MSVKFVILFPDWMAQFKHKCAIVGITVFAVAFVEFVPKCYNENAFQVKDMALYSVLWELVS